MFQNLIFLDFVIPVEDIMSSASGSTTPTSRGGISFEELCEGCQRTYAFNLVDLKRQTFEKRKELLIARIDGSLRELEFHSDEKVKHFCIGKTYATARTGKKFHPADRSTWRVDCISQRWFMTYNNEGYDGLVVLVAVNRDMLTDKKARYGQEERMCNTAVWDQQSYELALENALISHYAFSEFDPRLANRSLHPGQQQRSCSAGYVIYTAFKYAPKRRNVLKTASLFFDKEGSEQNALPNPRTAQPVANQTLCLTYF